MDENGNAALDEHYRDARALMRELLDERFGRCDAGLRAERQRKPSPPIPLIPIQWARLRANK